MFIELRNYLKLIIINERRSAPKLKITFPSVRGVKVCDWYFTLTSYKNGHYFILIVNEWHPVPKLKITFLSVVSQLIGTAELPALVTVSPDDAEAN